MPQPHKNHCCGDHRHLFYQAVTIIWVYILPQNHPQTCGIDFSHHIVVTQDLQPQYYTIASSSKVFYLQFIHIFLTVGLTPAQQVQPSCQVIAS